MKLKLCQILKKLIFAVDTYCQLDFKMTYIFSEFCQFCHALMSDIVQYCSILCLSFKFFFMGFLKIFHDCFENTLRLPQVCFKGHQVHLKHVIYFLGGKAPLGLVCVVAGTY